MAGNEPQDGPGPLRVIAVLAAVVVIAGGGTAAAVILTSDGGDGGTEPTDRAEAVSVADWCDAMNRLAESDDQELEEDPPRAAELLREIGRPEDMPVEAQRGRDLVIEIGEDANDGDEAEAAYQGLPKSDAADVDAFFAFYSENCLSPGPR